MAGVEWLQEWVLKLINSTWGATIIGWILGGMSSWLWGRRLARMQGETIRALSAALAKFEDTFKQNLAPLTDAENQLLSTARDAFVIRDAEPSANRLFWRTAKFPPIALAATLVFWASALYTVTNGHPVLGGGLGVLTVLAGLATMGTLADFKGLYNSVRSTVAWERVNEARQAVHSLQLNDRQFDHLRRWALGHAFHFLEKAHVLRSIELASISTRQVAAQAKARAVPQQVGAPAAQTS